MALGVKAQYADSVTQTRSVIPEFDLLNWKTFPLLKLLTGGSEDKPSLNNLSQGCEVVKYEWMEKKDQPVSGTLLDAIATAGATTLRYRTTGDANVTDSDVLFASEINEGTVIQIDSELMWVSANDTTNKQLTVQRGYAGTTAATHSALAKIYLATRAHKETAAAPTPRQLIPTLQYNYVQQFVDSFALTEIEQAVKRYGVTNAIEIETADRMRALMVAMSMSMFRGRRGEGTASNAASMGGFKQYMTSVAAGANATALSAAIVLNQMQACFDVGGMDTTPDTIVCNSFQRRKLTTEFSTTSGNVTTYRTQEERRAGVRVDVIVTDFGDIDILLDPWCPPDEVYLIKRDLIGIGPLKGKAFVRTMLAKTGPQDQWMIHGAYTMEVRKGAAAHRVVTNLTTS